MPRKGRGLEKLVALLEENLGPKGIKVKSPDYIKGCKSKSAREVDVSLRSQIGSSDILVIVECRDRKDTEDVDWIEQLSKKRRDVGADKAMAVSSTGFSSGAINMAEDEDVELRTLEDVDPDEVLSWFKFKHIDVLKNRVDFGEIEFLLQDGNENSIEFPPEVQSRLWPVFDLSANIFHSKQNKNPLSFMNIWERAKNKEDYYSKIEPGKPPVELTILLEFPSDKCIQIETNQGDKDVKYLRFKANLWIEEEKIPVRIGKVYKNGEKIVAQKAECEFEYIGNQFSVDLYKVPDSGKEFMKIRLKGKD